MIDFTGLHVATLTPFDESDRLALDVVRAHVDFLVDSGVAGVCPVGTTGEMLYLTIGEKVRLIEETTRAAAGRVKVIAGIWALREKEIALLGRASAAASADAVFLPPPIYYPATEDAIYRYYAFAREASGLPLFAYNIPAYAANKISVGCLERLVAGGVIVGIKDSTGNTEQMTTLLERFGDTNAVEAASDAFASEARSLGAHGFISALANIWPEALVRLWAGDDDVQVALTTVRAAVKAAGGIPALKFLAGKRGFSFGASRLPHSALNADSLASLDAAFVEANAVLT